MPESRSSSRRHLLGGRRRRCSLRVAGTEASSSSSCCHIPVVATTSATRRRRASVDLDCRSCPCSSIESLEGDLRRRQSCAASAADWAAARARVTLRDVQAGGQLPRRGARRLRRGCGSMAATAASGRELSSPVSAVGAEGGYVGQASAISSGSPSAVEHLAEVKIAPLVAATGRGGERQPGQPRTPRIRGSEAAASSGAAPEQQARSFESRPPLTVTAAAIARRARRPIRRADDCRRTERVERARACRARRPLGPRQRSHVARRERRGVADADRGDRMHAARRAPSAGSGRRGRPMRTNDPGPADTATLAIDRRWRVAHEGAASCRCRAST